MFYATKRRIIIIDERIVKQVFSVFNENMLDVTYLNGDIPSSLKSKQGNY